MTTINGVEGHTVLELPNGDKVTGFFAIDSDGATVLKFNWLGVEDFIRHAVERNESLLGLHLNYSYVAARQKNQNNSIVRAEDETFIELCDRAVRIRECSICRASPGTYCGQNKEIHIKRIWDDWA